MATLAGVSKSVFILCVKVSLCLQIQRSVGVFHFAGAHFEMDAISLIANITWGKQN